MTKKRVSQVNKEEEAKREAFWEDIRAVEKKHGRLIQAFIHYTQTGIIPVMGDREIKEKPADNKDKQ